MIRVAVVTGGNRGLGFAIVKKLCQKFEGVVILTARNEQHGQAACEMLKGDGLFAEFCKVDVTDEDSVIILKDYIRERYGGLDVLVNNAGIYFRSNQSSLSYSEQVNQTVDCDFFGLRRVCRQLFPLLRAHARVVNISSRMGKFSCVGPPIQDRLSSLELTEEELDNLMSQYKRDVQGDRHEQEGWPKDSLIHSWQNPAYCVSKLAVTILTRLQAKYFTKDETNKGILVNACCPGWLQTRLGGPNAPLTADQGADTPVYLTQLPAGAKWPNGKFLFERTVIPFVQAPIMRLSGVVGYATRKNDMIFCGTEAKQHVIFFPGDVQDYVENMSVHKETRAWQQWNLESTAKLLAKRFPSSFVWVVKSSRFYLDVYASYDNFVNTVKFGVPDHCANIGAVSHLRNLLHSAVRRVLNLDEDEEDITEKLPIILVGFSHGCVVLNQIVHELPEIMDSEDTGLLRFVGRIDTIHWLDSGHSGQSNAWITDERLLKTLAEVIPRLRAHLTPYQVRDKSRAWIGKEHAHFKQLLKSSRADIRSRIYFDDQPPSLCYHFKLLEAFEPV